MGMGTGMVAIAVAVGEGGLPARQSSDPLLAELPGATAPLVLVQAALFREIGIVLPTLEVEGGGSVPVLCPERVTALPILGAGKTGVAAGIALTVGAGVMAGAMGIRTGIEAGSITGTTIITAGTGIPG